MTTQLLIYETAVPVSSGRHGKAAIEAGRGYGFARKINSVPLTAVEFPLAAADYAIVFAQSGEEVVPVVILGARAGENLYVKDDDSWSAKYVPAFIRRYPFVFAAKDDGKTFTLCVDEAFQGLNVNMKLYYHRLGTPQSEDVLVYERPDQPKWGVNAEVSEDGRWLLISSQTMTKPREPVAATLTSAELDDYVGTYIANGVTVTIERKDLALASSTNGAASTKLEMEARDVAFTPGQPRLRRVFIRDGGKVTGFLSIRESGDVFFKRS